MDSVINPMYELVKDPKNIDVIKFIQILEFFFESFYSIGLNIGMMAFHHSFNESLSKFTAKENQSILKLIDEWKSFSNFIREDLI